MTTWLIQKMVSDEQGMGIMIWPLKDGDRFSLWFMLNSSCGVAILLVQVKDALGRLLFLDLELVRHSLKFSCQSSGLVQEAHGRVYSRNFFSICCYCLDWLGIGHLFPAQPKRCFKKVPTLTVEFKGEYLDQTYDSISVFSSGEITMRQFLEQKKA
ncbi:predicted protein [Arabidopsis lyrata subsp. lyrata]|uniref:Predicted protein n=1 Tax=Arabidopsis lyrata subsp. lyrata TaxID=81972 RepID=D7LFB3_ARALL|nr:predicted protein [Arabidopsis lyrata subsp. lyrata]